MKKQGFNVSNLLPDSVRKIVLEKITPSQNEIQKQRDIIHELSEALSARASTAGYTYSFIEAQGSTGLKQTQLKGATDIDLFVALNPEDYFDVIKLPDTERHEALDKLMTDLVSNWFEPALKNVDAQNLQRAFSQHPFLSLKMGGIEIDILGCFDIDADILAREGPITAVDRTIHHSKYIAERLTEKKREDIRILKSFVRACHAYGDTCAVGRMGVTGVSLELLVIFNDSLEEAIQSLRHLDTRPVDVFNRSLHDLKRIKSFHDDYLFLIDPTDSNRNIASSFTLRTYRWVQHQIDRLQEALEGGSPNLIELLLEAPIPTSPLPDWLKPNSKAYEFQAEKTIHYTILRDKLHRIARRIRSEMRYERTGEERFGRILSEIIFKDGRYALGILVEKPKISSSYTRRGPKISLKEAAKRFKESHQSAREEKGFLYIEVDREWTNYEKMLEVLLKENRIEGLHLLPSKSEVSDQVLNVLYRFILPIEPEFRERITRVKETENTVFE